jgi:glyoxalase family protein
VRTEGPARRWDDEVLAFSDHEGLPLELVAAAAPDARRAWGALPAESAIRGFHSVTLGVVASGATARLLTGTLGFRSAGDGSGRSRYLTGEPAGTVDVVAQPAAPEGVTSAGTVHHVAWRTPDDAAQLAWREEVMGAGFDVTPVLDRQYFHSIYFREPGGVLFEIATDQPGFTVDEPAEQLGSTLRLPPRLEALRPELEVRLPAFRLPAP